MYLNICISLFDCIRMRMCVRASGREGLRGIEESVSEFERTV